MREIFDFGSNPGNLRMFGYRPATLAANPALVVVLHGCTQTAADYDLGAGWSTLAGRYGFALLLPQQQRSNNPNGCFNWFQPEHTRRNQGEPLSIRQMIEKSVVDHGIDRRRIFITGLSAGGAMTSVMLACYPELFAGGAIIAGCFKVPAVRRRNGVSWYAKRGAGDELIEKYTITNMAHGTPLGIGEAEGACGAPGPFLLPVGISSSYHIAKFFGIAGAHVQAEGNASPEKNTLKISLAPRHDAAAEPVLEGEILDKDDEPILQQQPVPPLADIEAVINRALRAAGLLKG